MTPEEKEERINEIIKDVVCNDNIKKILKSEILKLKSDKPDPDVKKKYGKITKFQIERCKDNGTSIKKEGFQVGEPFDGDIINAPILFLSSNPSFNFNERSPRYFLDSDKLFMPEHITAEKQPINEGQYSFDEIKKNFEVPKEEIKLLEDNKTKNIGERSVKDFLINRIQNSPARNDDDETLRIPLKNGDTAEVTYWSCVRNNTKLLLNNLATEAREIMKYATCMEIVPFRSNNEKGINSELLDDCWNKYTYPLLELSGASVIVLVGDKVLDRFVDHIFLDKKAKKEAKKILREKKVYPPEDKTFKIGSKDRLVVKVDFNSGKFSTFEDFFESVVLDKLKKAVEDNLNDRGILKN